MSGATIWFTGLPSAGKTTLATGLAERLSADGHDVELLDGDEVREFLSKGLGFSREDRDLNVTRIGYVAALLASHGTTVLASVISPYAAARDKVRALHGERGAEFVEVYVATPVDVCINRDVKGLYARARAGDIRGMTGVDDPYEPPPAAEVVVPTHEQTIEQSIAQVHAALVERGLA